MPLQGRALLPALPTSPALCHGPAHTFPPHFPALPTQVPSHRLCWRTVPGCQNQPICTPRAGSAWKFTHTPTPTPRTGSSQFPRAPQGILSKSPSVQLGLIPHSRLASFCLLPPPTSLSSAGLFSLGSFLVNHVRTNPSFSLPQGCRAPGPVEGGTWEGQPLLSFWGTVCAACWPLCLQRESEWEGESRGPSCLGFLSSPGVEVLPELSAGIKWTLDKSSQGPSLECFLLQQPTSMRIWEPPPMVASRSHPVCRCDQNRQLPCRMAGGAGTWRSLLSSLVSFPELPLWGKGKNKLCGCSATKAKCLSADSE